MKLSYNWLNDYLDLSKITPSKIADALSLSTCEVESFYQSFPHLDDIQLAQVLTVEKHPNADRLSLCRVKSGQGEAQIVCGAPNVSPNMFAALAPVGAKLPPKETGGNFWEVRKAKIRGVESFGMLCSASELGIEQILSSTESQSDTEKAVDKQKGILDWEQLDSSSLKIGSPISQLLPLKDFIFDIDNKSITHRPDLWSHFGFARELSAIFHLPLRFDPLDLKPKKTEQTLPIKSINIAKGAALAYYGLSIGEVELKPTPLWMQARLINIGQGPINNIVDTSNYVMYDVGQPNHAFDARQLKEKSISVVLNNQDLKIESFTTLDGEERKLPKESILILDGPAEKKRAVALGGIMGGLASRVQDDTEELFVESATFPREYIRRSITALGLRTDSAQRFEKGQDPAQAAPALYRFAQLLKQSCPNLKIGPICGQMSVAPKKNKIVTDLAFIQSRLGFAISTRAVREILESLGFTVQVKETKTSQKKAGTISKKPIGATEFSFKITAPTYRSQYDLSIAEDIVEELGRLHGYDNIQAQAPSAHLTSQLPHPRIQIFRKLREYFAYSMNFNETYNYSFSTSKHNQFWNKQALCLQNPVFDHKKELRLSLLPGLLEQAALNQDRFLEVRLFEAGRVYWQASENTNEESQHLACVFLPTYHPASKDTGKEQLSLPMQEALLHMRQKMEALLQSFLGSDFCCIQMPLSNENFNENTLQDYLAGLHPKASLLFASTVSHTKKEIFASIGVLHPAWESHFEIKRPALLLDLNFDVLYDAIEQKKSQKFSYQKPSVYPDSYFEISLLLPMDTGSHVPFELIQKMAIPEIASVRYLTEYRGLPLNSNQKSVSYEIACHHPNETLKSEKLQNILDRVVAHLKEAGFALRT